MFSCAILNVCGNMEVSLRFRRQSILGTFANFRDLGSSLKLVASENCGACQNSAAHFMVRRGATSDSESDSDVAYLV